VPSLLDFTYLAPGTYLLNLSYALLILGPLKPNYALLMPGPLKLNYTLLVPGPLKLSYTLLMLGLLRLSCALLVPSPLKLSYTLLVPGPLKLSYTLLVPGPLKLNYTLLFILGPLKLSYTPLLVLSPLKLSYTPLLMPGPLKLSYTPLLVPDSTYLALGVHPLLILSLLDSACLALGIYLLNPSYISFPDLLDLPPLLTPIPPELLGVVLLIVQSALLDLLGNIIPISTSICSKYLVISWQRYCTSKTLFTKFSY